MTDTACTSEITSSRGAPITNLNLTRLPAGSTKKRRPAAEGDRYSVFINRVFTVGETESACRCVSLCYVCESSYRTFATSVLTAAGSSVSVEAKQKCGHEQSRISATKAEAPCAGPRCGWSSNVVLHAENVVTTTTNVCST